jgi:hypothetical protein
VAATVLLTPYADTGESNVAFRSVLAVSSQSTPAGAVEVGVTAQPATLPKHPSLTGEFRVQRSGSTASALTVRLVWDGTAVAGTDYTALPDTIVIPAGTNAAVRVLQPLPAGGLGTVVARVVDAEGYTAGTVYEAGIAIVAPTYAAWAEARWPDRPAADRLPEADPLGEGVPNLIRYAMSKGPAGASETIYPALIRQGTPVSGPVRLSVRRVRGLTDVIYRMEFSTQFAGWNDQFNGAPAATAGAVTDLGDGTETVEFEASASAAAEAKGFFRYRIEPAP